MSRQVLIDREFLQKLLDYYEGEVQGGYELTNKIREILEATKDPHIEWEGIEWVPLTTGYPEERPGMNGNTPVLLEIAHIGQGGYQSWVVQAGYRKKTDKPYITHEWLTRDGKPFPGIIYIMRWAYWPKGVT